MQAFTDLGFLFGQVSGFSWIRLEVVELQPSIFKELNQLPSTLADGTRRGCSPWTGFACGLEIGREMPEQRSGFQ